MDLSELANIKPPDIASVSIPDTLAALHVSPDTGLTQAEVDVSRKEHGNYSFGELSATAISRRETLERLIPRLKIADKCVLSDRFLLVQGTRRRYKIHLGSGNILMEPNDQYLCIVPDARARAGAPQVHLPFEGDATLSIILSKAFLLAEDRAIKDPVILRQLGK